MKETLLLMPEPELYFHYNYRCYRGRMVTRYCPESI